MGLMAGRTQEPARFGVAGVVAGLLVLLLVCGRWTLSRVTSMDLGWLGEPRVLVALALLVLVASPGLREHASPLARQGSTRTMLRMLLFFGYMALSSLWAPDGADPNKVVELGLVLVAGFSALRLIGLVEPQRAMELVWRWLLPLLAAFAVLGIAFGGAGGGRLAVLGGGPNVFGRNMGILCVAAFAMGLRRRNDGLTLGGMVVAGALVVLSGSRGALLATAGGMAVVLYFNTSRIRKVVTVGLVVAVVTIGVLELTDFGAQVLEMFRHRVLQLAVEDRYDSGRTAVYQSAWELGLDAPLFGIGLAGFAVAGNHVYPHNVFLEVFCEGGLVGVVLLMLLLWPPLAAIARRRSGADPRDHAAFIVALISAQFSGDLYDTRTVFVLAIFLVMLTSTSRDRSFC